jgi:hypothetical protein
MMRATDEPVAPQVRSAARSSRGGS